MKQVNVDEEVFAIRTWMIIGDRGVGKTLLGGSFCHYHKNNGDVAYFDVKGEDSRATLRGTGLGDKIWVIERAADIMEIKKMSSAKPLEALVIDGLPSLYDLYQEMVCGDGIPENFKQWGAIYHKFGRLMKDLRLLANHVLVLSPTDAVKSEVDAMQYGGDKESSARIGADLPGKQPSQVRGKFDMVGYLYHVIQGKNIKRYVMFGPHPKILTRQRLVNRIEQDIPIPLFTLEDPGACWRAIQEVTDRHTKEGLEKAIKRESNA